MYFPHTIQKKVVTDKTVDEYGHVVSGGQEEWVTLSKCRCDDNNAKEFTNENGTIYRPSYHVVCLGKLSVKEGDTLRCKMGDEIRGEGTAYNVYHHNWFNRTEIWI